jgi:hypothetical protein
VLMLCALAPQAAHALAAVGNGPVGWPRCTRATWIRPAQPLLARPQATVWPGRSRLALPMQIGLRSWFWPNGLGLNEIPFQFLCGLNLSLNFENSYISVHSSKNHETGHVGFVILWPIHEKYLVEQ